MYRVEIVTKLRDKETIWCETYGTEEHNLIVAVFTNAKKDRLSDITFETINYPLCNIESFSVTKEK